MGPHLNWFSEPGLLSYAHVVECRTGTVYAVYTDVLWIKVVDDARKCPSNRRR